MKKDATRALFIVLIGVLILICLGYFMNTCKKSAGKNIPTSEYYGKTYATKDLAVRVIFENTDGAATVCTEDANYYCTYTRKENILYLESPASDDADEAFKCMLLIVGDDMLYSYEYGYMRYLRG